MTVPSLPSPASGQPPRSASFVVPLFNGLSLTQAMLASLRATVPASIAYEVILVDDGSADGTREWLVDAGQSRGPGSGGDRGQVRSILNEKNLGFAATCNRGAAVAQGDYLFFLNNDLVLLPGWLEPMLAVFAERADAGLVGNVQLNFATGAVDHAGLVFNAKGKPEHVTDLGARREPHRAVVAVTGACFAIRAAIWKQLGGFDEGYINGCEDVDLGLRARQARLTNYVALHSVVRHHVSASLGRKLRDEQNTARLISRWRPHIISLMPRACARACLAAAWENPRDYVRLRVAYESFLYLIGLVPEPTPEIIAAASQALDLETARWAHLLHDAPPPSPHDIAPAWFPARPDKSPI